MMMVTVLVIGSLRYRRFQGNSDKITQVDWVRGCCFHTITKVVKILTTAGHCDQVVRVKNFTTRILN